MAKKQNQPAIPYSFDNFLMLAKTALEIQKTRISFSNRLYSNRVETLIRGHPYYDKFMALRRKKETDRKELEKLRKQLISDSLETIGLSEEAWTEEFETQKAKSTTFQGLIALEDLAFKDVEPMLEKIPVIVWMNEVKGLGLRYEVKLISKIKTALRFDNPSKLRTYCGTVPGQRRVDGVESHFSPELKGVLLGQVAKNFLMNRSQYKQIYDEKKAYYQKLHPEFALHFAEKLALLEKQKGRKLVNGEKKEIWTDNKIDMFAKKTMINRFLVDLWMAWYYAEGKNPPKNPWIADQPHHSLDPMIVPFSEEMAEKCRLIRDGGLPEKKRKAKKTVET